jgi:polar amino acid transport system substrate-binding protein
VYQLSKTGEYDGTLAYARTVEREKFYHYSDPVYTGKYVLFHLKAHPFKWNKYEDLKDIRIAATRGFGGMGKEFIAAEENKVIQVERLASDIQSFHMLFLGRVQAVASDMEVGYVLLKKNFPAKEVDYVTHNEHIIQSAKYHLVLAKSLKKSPELIKKFNLGLAQLKKSGRYDKIIKDFYDKKVYKEALPLNYTSSAQAF